MSVSLPLLVPVEEAIHFVMEDRLTGETRECLFNTQMQRNVRKTAAGSEALAVCRPGSALIRRRWSQVQAVAPLWGEQFKPDTLR
jgi:hypothetical protein